MFAIFSTTRIRHIKLSFLNFVATLPSSSKGQLFQTNNEFPNRHIRVHNVVWIMGLEIGGGSGNHHDQ